MVELVIWVFNKGLTPGQLLIDVCPKLLKFLGNEFGEPSDEIDRDADECGVARRPPQQVFWGVRGHVERFSRDNSQVRIFPIERLGPKGVVIVGEMKIPSHVHLAQVPEWRGKDILKVGRGDELTSRVNDASTFSAKCGSCHL